MKFYLTKAAQRAAESGQPPVMKQKVAKAPSLKAEKAHRLRAETSPSARRTRPAAKDAGAHADVATAPAVAPFSAPAVSQQFGTASTAPSSPLTAPVDSSVGVATVAPATPEGPSTLGKAPRVAPLLKEKKGIIAIGGQPRVDLLPLEVRAERKAGQNVKRAWLGVAAVVVLVGLGAGGATFYAQGASGSLASSQRQTGVLSQQAAKYSKVQQVQSKVDLMNAAREVGGSTDVDWPTYLAKVALTVPSGATLKGVTVDSASPVTAYAQASSPLEGQRIATITLTATSNSLPSVPAWLNSLTSLPGYVDATAGSVALSDGVYTATVTLHINEKAYSNAFKKGK